MRTVLVMLVATSLLLTPVPSMAQPQQSLAAAIAQEASTPLESVQPASARNSRERARADWSGLSRIPAGTPIVVETCGDVRHPKRRLLSVDEQEVVVRSLDQTIERFARADVTEIRGYSFRRGTFLGNVGGVFWIGGAVTGLVLGARLGHRAFTDHRVVGGVSGGVGGYVVGLSTGFAITSLIDALDGDNVFFRARTLHSTVGYQPSVCP